MFLLLISYEMAHIWYLNFLIRLFIYFRFEVITVYNFLKEGILKIR